MEKIKVTETDVWNYVTDILHFDREEIREKLVSELMKGKSVILDAVAYKGNGKWVNPSIKKRYKYKMIVPIKTKDDLLYSTDLYEDFEKAVNAPYEVYRSTRQMAIKIVTSIDTDYEMKRFGFGYKDGSYGIYKIV